MFVKKYILSIVDKREPERRLRGIPPRKGDGMHDSSISAWKGLAAGLAAAEGARRPVRRTL